MLAHLPVCFLLASLIAGLFFALLLVDNESTYHYSRIAILKGFRMATLFERVSGLDENKIPIHLIRSCLSEINSGRMTVAQSVAIMGLDETQTTDLVKVLTEAGNSSNSSVFSSRVFAYLILSEISGNIEHVENGQLTDYADESKFWTMISAEGAK